jgi:hypothetical protein
MMDYEYQPKKDAIYKLSYIVSEIYILSIYRFRQLFFVCEYQLWSRCTSLSWLIFYNFQILNKDLNSEL